MPRAPKNARTSSRRAQSPSTKKSKDRRYPCPLGCGKPFERKQERDRHILTFHLPDCYCCPDPVCTWRGHRRDTLEEHISKGGCSIKPEWEDQCMIYDKKLILEWILEKFVPIDVGAMYALELVQERATQLGKEDAWSDLWPMTKERQRFVT